MPEVDLAQELDRFREKLLDISNRNPLLNYRKSRSRTLEIVDELPDQVFQRLVSDGKRFRFDPQEEAEEPAQSLALSLYGDLPESVAADGEESLAEADGDRRTSVKPRNDSRHSDDRLQTLLSPERLEVVLKGMARESATAIEETGVNYLFLAVGMLNWKEKDQSEKVHLAPLILLPVAFERSFNGRTLKYEYSIRWQGDELQYNLSLAKRLQRDFGLKLPEYDGEQLPEVYFFEVEKSLGSQPGWSVQRDLVIGFFSFQKMLMYLDLDPTAWDDRGLLTPESIAGTIIAGQELDVGSSLYASDYDIDQQPQARKVAVVTDADSSQHSALLDIAEGKNLVIEGPPGTGKSQTITNAIAAAINDGKTILFVSEKLAALKVVSNRLDQLGLGKFCLELHSDSGPKRVYESLKERMNASFQRPHELDAVRSDAARRQRTIGEYLTATAEASGPYAEPLYEVMWRTVEMRSRGIRSARHATFDAGVDRSTFDENAQLLEAFVDALKEVEEPRSSPWWGFWATSVNPNDLDPIADVLAALHECGKQAETASDRLEADCGHGLVQWLVNRDQSEAADVGLLAERAAGLKAERDLAVLRSPHCRKLARDLLETLSRAQSLLAESSEYFLSERTAAEKCTTEVRRLISQKLKPCVGDASLRTLRFLKSRLNTLATVLGRVDEVVTTLQSQGLGPIRTTAEYQHAEELFRLLRHPILNDLSSLPAGMFLANSPGLFKQAQGESAQLCEARERHAASFDLDSLPPREDIKSITKRLRPYTRAWWRFLFREYRSAKKELLGFTRSGIGTTPTSWVKKLEQLGDHLAAERKFQDRADLKGCLGDAFLGIATDWEKGGTLLKWAATAANRGLDHSSATVLLSKRVDGELRSAQIIDARQQLKAELDHPGIASCLGLRTSVENESLADVRTRANALLADIQAFEEAALPLKLADELTLEEVSQRAEAIEKAGQLRDRCNARATWCDLGAWYDAMETDAGDLASAVDWVGAVCELGLPVDAELRLLGASPAESCLQLANAIRRMEDTRQQWCEKRQSLSLFGRLNDDWLPLIDKTDWRVVGRDVVARLQMKIDDLPAWSALCRLLVRCETQNLASFSTLALDGRISLEQLPECYRLSVLERVVETKLCESPSLKDFSRQTIEKAREHYKQLDRQLLQFTQDQVAADATKRPAPAGNSRGRVAEFTEMGLIRNEIQKQQRFCRIRELLLRAGRAVQALKPCFMMSPLSVAQYLAPEGIQFDLVIMDEASQIKPEDALGTVLRAQQLVVVGDPKQLPPTSFFDRVDDGVDDSDATQLDNAESVLEVAMKVFQPVRRLRWHYRSQHESLIHFSNDRFYDRDLVVFPSASTGANRLGLRHHHVEGGQFLGGGNVEEAKVVAAAIVEHARQAPEETLGVGTFNLKQRDLIQDCLEKICEQDTVAREAVDRLNENKDKLFIKNLENLQGDERDVIFVSYTYGPDPDTGKVMNRFGPITGGFGWRRLNVLITRARRRVEVFSSMKASDILGGPDRSLGVNAMKDYLEFSKTGCLPDRGLYSGKAPDSPFELAVGAVITRMGLEIVPQVGVAGYFIDLGVLKPGTTGDFLLGVECDGAAYHSAKSARDRDRLREEVIRRRGWNLHRIWSTDWFLNQKHEEERLLQAIRQALGAAPT